MGRLRAATASSLGCGIGAQALARWILDWTTSGGSTTLAAPSEKSGPLQGAFQQCYPGRDAADNHIKFLSRLEDFQRLPYVVGCGDDGDSEPEDDAAEGPGSTSSSTTSSTTSSTSAIGPLSDDISLRSAAMDWALGLMVARDGGRDPPGGVRFPHPVSDPRPNAIGYAIVSAATHGQLWAVRKLLPLRAPTAAASRPCSGLRETVPALPPRTTSHGGAAALVPALLQVRGGGPWSSRCIFRGYNQLSDVRESQQLTTTPRQEPATEVHRTLLLRFTGPATGLRGSCRRAPGCHALAPWLKFDQPRPMCQ